MVCCISISVYLNIFFFIYFDFFFDMLFTGIFLISIYFWISSFLSDFFIHSIVLDMISLFLNLLRLVCGLTYYLFWRTFCVHLRICILILLDEIFYKCLLSPSGLMWRLSSMFCCWFSIWIIYWLKWGIEDPFSYCIAIRSVNIDFIYLGASTLGT